VKNQPRLITQKFTGLIDRINDKLTSYRLVLYFLLALVGWAMLGSFFHNQVPYSWNEILVSAGWLVGICWLTNKAISKFLDIPANKESDLISGLILALILSPPTTAAGFTVLAAAGVAAMASKYVITLSKSHLFNPAAAGAFIAGEVFHKYPSWWVGTKFMTPLVVIGGLLVLRKMKRFSLVGVFLAVFFLYLIYGTSSGSNLHFLWLELISTQLLFFAVIMLTEPMTSPTSLQKGLPYAGLVGILYTATKLRLSPEEALLLGNLFTFVVARNQRYKLKFIGKLKEAEGIYSYAFSKPRGFKFKPGQYMEWTIAHNKTDSRGNRRYLTISSSPTEPGLMFSVKRPNPARPVESATPARDKRAFHGPSSFKQRLDELKPGETILAGHLAGSFTLPKDNSKKIALLAGGIGVTPFRSMVKQLVDSGQQRDIALLYSANSPAEISFQKLFDKAGAVGLRANYVTQGHLDEAKIKNLLPDFTQRRFYVSGPYAFVNVVQSALLKLGVNSSEIVTDYFPGYG
jgi:ferredoxin-NADP reductase/Na+-translocating ferredoxin:NAD+ oxidoreductase RnfD subunit